MEALERLQSVHTTLRLMREHALCSSGSDGPAESSGLASDRFVADFFIFLAQTSANAEELKKRCNTLLKTLPKVTAFLGEGCTLVLRLTHCDQAIDLRPRESGCGYTLLDLKEYGEQDMIVEPRAGGEAARELFEIFTLRELEAVPVTMCYGHCLTETSGRGQDAVKVPTTGCESLLEKTTQVPSPIAGHAFCRNDDKDSTIIFTSENIHRSKLHKPNSPSQGMFKKRLLATHLAPLVGLKAMERASTTLEDFCRSYFMFHEMDVHNPQQLFKYLPLLSFVEAFIYQLDEENEEQVRAPNSGSEAFLSYSSNQDSQDAVQSKTCSEKQDRVRDSSSVNRLRTQPFRGLERALADQGLLTERIISELRDGVEYWRLECVLCEAMINGDHISPEHVLTAIQLKSFDYRVLNLLLYSLTGREVNEAHFNFLAVSELLVEISDDLYDYEDDVLKNSFNVLRMLVKVYGPAKAPEMLAKLISEQEVRYQQLLDGLEPNLAKHYRERCKEATHEGGGGSKYQFGSWTLPPLILDEEAFRTQIQPASPSQKCNEYRVQQFALFNVCAGSTSL